MGLSVARLVTRLAGSDTAADLLDDGTGAASALVGRLTEERLPQIGQRIAEDLEQYLRVEFGLAEPNDREAALTSLSELLARELSDPERLIDATREGGLLLTYLMRRGGESMAESLGGEAGAMFAFLLERSVERISTLAPRLPGFQPAALVHLVRTIDEVSADVHELTERPIAGTLVANDVLAAAQRVRGLLPEVLIDREHELSVMAHFATEGPARWWLWQAPSQSGKTALMATFAVRHHPGVAVVPFFVRRVTAAARDRQAFLAEVLPRLAHLAGDRYLSSIPTNAVQEVNAFRVLLTRAGASCQSRDRPAELLLLIDGLDEDDWYREPVKGSILALLPTELPPGTRVLLASRPNPPLPSDIEQGSPLHDLTTEGPLHELAESPHAHAAFDRSDVLDFMKFPVGEAVAAFMLAAGSPLTIGDLAEAVRECLPGATEAEVREIIETSHGRLLTPLPVDPSRHDLKGYTLAHDRIGQHVLTVLEPTLAELGLDRDDALAWSKHSDRILAPWIEKISQWAMKNQQTGWPQTTPTFLLSDALPALLVNHGKFHELAVEILTDGARQDRIAERHGTLASALRQVRVAQAELLRQHAAESPMMTGATLDLLGRLVFTDQDLSRRLGRIPEVLPAAYARAGYHSMAQHLVDGTFKPRLAQLAIAEAYLAAKDPQRALAATERLVQDIHREPQTPQTFEFTRRLVRVLVAAGGRDRARRLVAEAGSVPGSEHQSVVEEAVRSCALVGLHRQARELVDQLPENDRCQVVLHAAYDCLGVGDLVGALLQAEELAAWHRSDSSISALDMVALARLYLRCDKLDSARLIAHRLTGVASARVYAACAEALLAVGKTDEAAAASDAAAGALSDVDRTFARKDFASVASLMVRVGDAVAAATLIDSCRDIFDANAWTKMASAFFAISEAESGGSYLELAYQSALLEGADWSRLDAIAEIMWVAVDSASAEFVDSLVREAIRICDASPRDEFVVRAVARCAEELARSGRVDGAVSLVQRLDAGPDTLGWRAVWQGVVKSTQPERALAVLLQSTDGRLEGGADNASELAIELAYRGHGLLALEAADHARAACAGGDLSRTDLSEVAISLAHIGELDLALAALQAHDSHPTVYGPVFREAALRDYQHAEGALSVLSEDDPRLFPALIGLAEAALLDTRQKDAVTLISRATAVVSQPNFDGSEESVAQLAVCAAQANTPGLAESVIDSAAQACRPFYGYARVAADLARLGEEAAAQSAGRQAVERARSLEDPLIRLAACSLVGQTLSRQTELASLVVEAATDGLQVVDGLLASGQDQSRRVAVDRVEVIIAALARCGEAESARHLVGTYGDEIQSRVLEIGCAFAAAGNLAMALETIDRSPQNRDGFAGHLVAAMSGSGHVNDVRQLAAEITNPRDRATAVMHVARSLAATGGQAAAIDEIKTAMDAASLVDHGGSRLLADAAYLLAVLKQFDRATEVAVAASQAPDCESQTLVVCAEALRICGEDGMATRCLAEAWVRDHDACIGWRTLVQIEEPVALALAGRQWGSSGVEDA
ncbi:hypothetical protein ACFVWG_20665 [Kribbella sp. NPDC058245]|uniref:NACHT N-terminal Helical domain 1-containing protein n=1 Tax=Kribbella sp. NPDC058245 TaxID=3346399 RepID=UPI0036E6B0C3